MLRQESRPNNGVEVLNTISQVIRADSRISLGLAIVRNLALQYPKSAFNNGPLLIYLTARDQGRGEQAIKDLQNDAELKKAKALASHGGSTSIQFHGLDISKPKSITDFALFLKEEHPDGIDIVVNNAGIAMNGFGMLLLCASLFSY